MDRSVPPRDRGGLRTGFTTGACSAAAAKAAARCLAKDIVLTEIGTTLPNGQDVTFDNTPGDHANYWYLENVG